MSREKLIFFFFCITQLTLTNVFDKDSLIGDKIVTKLLSDLCKTNHAVTTLTKIH